MRDALLVILVVLAAWFTLALAAVGAWNIAKAIVRRRREHRRDAEYQRERESMQ